MSISSQKLEVPETNDSYTPPGVSSSSRTGTPYRKSDTPQSHQESISNSSVHTSTAAVVKDSFELSEQDPSNSDLKSFHAILKSAFYFRNQSPSTVSSSIRDTPRSSLAIFRSLTPSPGPAYSVFPSHPLGDGDSHLPPIMEITETSTTDTPSITPADFLPHPTDHMGTASHSSLDLVTLKTTPSAAEVHAVTRVRALHSFEATEPNELTFEKGDIIKVLNRDYKDWWWGQLNGVAGVFPVNYVEALPEPTSAELAAEAQQEASLFSQAANVDRLLTMLRTHPEKENLADNEEIQELYRSCMFIRPKIVKLIDKYSQKCADLVSMNESFTKARIIFDGMMEESLARHIYKHFSQAQSTYPGAESRVHGQQPPGYGRPADQPQPYALNLSEYDQAGYGVYPNAEAPPYPAQDNPRTSYYPQARPQQAEGERPPEKTPQKLPQVQSQPHLRFAQSQISTQTQPQAQTQSVPQQQPQTQAQTSHSPVETHASLQPQPRVQKQETLTGPPFVFDPTATYPDQNVQAWAQYYAQGGTDPTGSVYFISVPGINGRGTTGGRKTTSAITTSQIGHVFFARLRERFTWPNRFTRPPPPESIISPYMLTSTITNGEAARPVNDEVGGPGMGARPPWEATTATTTTLPEQFEQIRVT